MARRARRAETCRAVLSRVDGTVVSDEIVEASAASLRRIDRVEWHLPDGDYVMRIEAADR
ncbi:hypothetical protein N3K63_05885 [Microbacterium sp. W1N]|uniref:hypothetical protein n=1 Tax=Microbacterium festucae TaxID=2977531 RepID=UPI0021C05212|nr:hypothetical protein [Microbacterium festucae]MCT9819818.1 hypothetical protein [Microbacterium festucae]